MEQKFLNNSQYMRYQLVALMGVALMGGSQDEWSSFSYKPEETQKACGQVRRLAEIEKYILEGYSE